MAADDPTQVGDARVELVGDLAERDTGAEHAVDCFGVDAVGVDAWGVGRVGPVQGRAPGERFVDAVSFE